MALLGGAFYFGRFNKTSPFQEQLTNINAPQSSITQSKDRNTTSTTTNQLEGKLAFIRGNNLWVSINGNEKQLTSDAVPTELPFWTRLLIFWYSNPQIAPDGNSVAFLKNVDTNARQLYVTTLNGAGMKKLADDVEWTFPIMQWSKDNQKIFYASAVKGQIDKEGRQILKVKAVNISGDVLQEYGQFNVRSGCGGGSSDIADHLAVSENIEGVGSGIMVFALSPDNKYLVHSTACTGSGLGILNLQSKQDTLLSDKGKNGVISPDGQKVAYIDNDKIVTSDIASGKSLNTYTVSEAPVILLWNPDSKTIYYSSDKVVKELKLDDKVAMSVWGSSPMSYRVRTASLWSLSLDTQKDKKLTEQDTHAVKPLYANGNKLLFVSVENATRLFENTKQTTSKQDLVKYYPQVKIHEVDLTTLTVKILISQVQQSSFAK